MLSLIEIKKVFGNEIVLNHLSGDFQKASILFTVHRVVGRQRY